MKVKIYRLTSIFYVFVKGRDGWYRSYLRYSTNANKLSYRLKKKKLSRKYITKFFKKLNTEFDEIGLDQHIEAYNMTPIVSYEIKK